MAVLNIFSPGFPLVPNSTLYIPNPWATSDQPASGAWIQCTTNSIGTLSGGGFVAVVGIIEYEYIDGNGQIQQATFGNASDLNDVNIFGLPARMFVSQLLSVTVAYIGDQVGINPCVTIFQWG